MIKSAAKTQEWDPNPESPNWVLGLSCQEDLVVIEMLLALDLTFPVVLLSTPEGLNWSNIWIHFYLLPELTPSHRSTQSSILDSVYWIFTRPLRLDVSIGFLTSSLLKESEEDLCYRTVITQLKDVIGHRSPDSISPSALQTLRLNAAFFAQIRGQRSGFQHAFNTSGHVCLDNGSSSTRWLVR